MKREEIIALAENIATEILTVNGNPHAIVCTRAQMMLEEDGGIEKNMGGRNKISIVTVIVENLSAALRE